MTSDPGSDVLCPSCHQVTAPGAFCTRCGAALPFDIGFRSDSRSEIQERMRLRREGRIGATAVGGEAFEPEPTDTLRQTDDEAVPLPAEPDWPVEPERVAEPEPASQPEPEPVSQLDPEPDPGAELVAPIAAMAVASKVVAPPPPEPVIYDAEPAPPPPPRPPRPTRPGGGDGGKSDGAITPAVFVGFLVLGLIALLGGAALAGVFRGDGVAQASPTPTASVDLTPVPTEEGTPVASVEASATPRPSDASPTSFPDGFLARAEPCASEPTAPTCDSSGATNSGDLWVLVSFRHATFSDVIGVAIVDSSGNLQADASLDLGFCGSSTDCAGYTYFPFTNLDPGEYRVRVTRNGTPAAETTFEVVS